MSILFVVEKIISTLRWGDTSTNTRQYSNLCSTQCL